MKKLFTLLFILFFFFVKADYWTQKASYSGGAGRSEPFSFGIDNKGYFGCGIVSGSSQQDFWEYDQATNIWTQKANFGGAPRFNSIGFSIGSNGYSGLGNGSGSLSDLWEYNSITNIWSQKASLPLNIYPPGATNFASGNYGYIFSQDQLIQYDPVSDVWTLKAPLPAPNRGSPISFSIGNKSYIGSGYNGSFLFQDFWEDNSINNSWLQKASFIAPGRVWAASFTITNQGYFGTGCHPNFPVFMNDFWQYDVLNDQWNQKTNFGGIARCEPFFFALGNKGYIGLGGNNLTPLIDFREYTPDSITNIQELPTFNLEFTISPNPAKDYIVINYPSSGKENIYITITDVNGRIVEMDNYPSPQPREIKINLHTFSKEIYFVELSNGK